MNMVQIEINSRPIHAEASPEHQPSREIVLRPCAEDHDVLKIQHLFLCDPVDLGNSGDGLLDRV